MTPSKSNKMTRRAPGAGASTTAVSIPWFIRLLVFVRRGVRRRAEELAQLGAGIGGTHERLADQEAVDALVAQHLQILNRVNSGFGHEGAVADAVLQAQGRAQRGFEGTQVAIVHTDQGHRKVERDLELFFV